MAKGFLIAFTNPVDAEHEAEYNRWYEEEHVPLVLSGGEFTRAARFRATRRISRAGLDEVGSTEPRAYLAIYEIDSDDSIEAIAERVFTNELPNATPSAANDATTAHGVFYEQISDWRRPGQ